VLAALSGEAWTCTVAGGWGTTLSGVGRAGVAGALFPQGRGSRIETTLRDLAGVSGALTAAFPLGMIPVRSDVSWRKAST